MPFYSTNGSLMWFAGNGKVYSSEGMIADNAIVHLWASRNDMSVESFIAAARAAGTAAGRALTLSEMAFAGSGVESASVRRVA
jgi:hypothetical protein